MIKPSPIPHYAAAIDVIRARLAEFGVPYDEIEEELRIARGHLTRWIAKPPRKIPHIYNFFNLLDVLGMHLHVVFGPVKWRKKKKRLHWMQRKPSIVTVITPDQRRINGRKGGISRGKSQTSAQQTIRAKQAWRVWFKSTTPEQRREWARHAIKARWRKKMIAAGMGK